MSQPKITWAVWGGLMLTIAVIAGAFAWSHTSTPNASLPVIGQVSDFTLTNQENRAVSLADLRGQVWVADVIFTRCPGPCPTMTRHLAEIQAALPAGQPVKLVTLTSDPDYDSPAMMKRFADHFGVKADRWWFLTGDKKILRSLEVNDCKFVVVDKQAGERTIPDDLFIHSTWYVLVDKQGRLRGWTDEQGQLHAYYDSEDADARAKLLAVIPQLLRE